MILIRKTTHEDVPLLSEIQRQAFLPIYRKYHDKGNPCLRGPEDILKRLDTPVFRYYTVLVDSGVAGGVLYRCSGSTPFIDELPENEYYLTRVYVRPEMQSRHIARDAILMCEKEFAGAKAFHVDFPVDLEKNRKCYEACGFSDTGKRIEVENGLVLACYEKRI